MRDSGHNGVLGGILACEGTQGVFTVIWRWCAIRRTTKVDRAHSTVPRESGFQLDAQRVAATDSRAIVAPTAGDGLGELNDGPGLGNNQTGYAVLAGTVQ